MLTVEQIWVKLNKINVTANFIPHPFPYLELILVQYPYVINQIDGSFMLRLFIIGIIICTQACQSLKPKMSMANLKASEKINVGLKAISPDRSTPPDGEQSPPNWTNSLIT